MEVRPRTIKNLIGCLAAACLFSTSGALNAQEVNVLNPSTTSVTATTLDFNWNYYGTPLYAVLSDTDTFITTVSSDILNDAPGISYTGLNVNTTYYFKVKNVGDPDTAYEEITAVTLPNAPSGIYFNSEGFQSYLMTGSVIRIGWNTAGNPPDTLYQVDYALAGFDEIGASTTIRGYPPVDVGGLAANTLYNFRVSAVNWAGSSSEFAESISTFTLALVPSGITSSVYETTATVSWNAVSNSKGYRLILSSSANMANLIGEFVTVEPETSFFDLPDLETNTTYYYKLGSMNQFEAINSDYLRSFTTLSAQPQDLQLISVDTQAVTLGWTALPVEPSSATADGYRLEASSTDFDGTDVYRSTATYDILNSTLTLSGLGANTTYYFRVAALNKNSDPHYSLSLSSITLSVPLSTNLLTTIADPLTLTVNLGSPLPSVPQSGSCEGYLLEGSSQTFGSESFIYSAVSDTNFTTSLTLSGLRSNTTYYLRIATLNWTKTPNFSDLPAVVTPIAGALASVPVAGVWESSVAVSFAAIDYSDGYVLEASPVRYFNPIAASSSTTDALTAGLTVTDLYENTSYYFRVGTLYNGATVYTLADPVRRYTLPKPLTDQAITAVYYTSATVSWTALASSPSSATAAGYYLEASTSPEFDRLAGETSTNDPLTGSLTIQDLLPNTSYYFRAGTANLDGAKNYVYTPSTATLANPAIQAAFTNLTTGQMTVNWLDNSNPPDTVYFIRFSSSSDYSSVVFSSATLNTYATFSGLSTNTTYYSEITSMNRLDIPEGPYSFNAMATLASDPVPGAFSSLGISSITLNWDIGDNPPDDTPYKAEISSSPVFAQPILSSVTLSTSHTFYGLVSNATYYLRISALNRTGIGTTPIPMEPPAALTLPATAYLLSGADTFSNLMTDSFTLHWAENGNSSHTVYNIEISTYNTAISTDIAVSTTSNFNAWARSSSTTVNGLSCTFNDLTLGTTYWAKIQAQGQTGITTDFVLTSTITTLRSTQAGALVSRETTVTLQTSYGLISLFMPAGSLGGSTRITIEPTTLFMPPVSAVSVLRPTGIGLEITRFPPVLVLSPVTITFPYRLSDLPSGINRSNLVLALYDEVNHIWVPLPSVSDRLNNTVTAQTWHLSTFQLMEASPSASLGTVSIYPNPYQPSSVGDVMHFTNMPPYAKVKIYTFLGELVKEFSADINGMAYWDGKNSGGQKAASGVYIALLKTKDKSSSKMVKIVIER